MPTSATIQKDQKALASKKGKINVYFNYRELAGHTTVGTPNAGFDVSLS